MNDPELNELLHLEEARRRDTLEMVASESLQDRDSLALQGSVFCGKTAVGLPGHQRLGGSEIADRLEALAASRARALFRCGYANVLPYSGTVANHCVYKAFLKPGDTVLSLDPECGSHASHGRSGHLSAEVYRFVHFGVKPDSGLLDYEEAERLLEKECPAMLVVGASSYPRLIDWERLASAARRTGTILTADMAHITGLVAAGVVPSPVPYADAVTASGTKTMCSAHTGFILSREEYAEALDRAVYPGMVASVHLQTAAALCHAFRRAGTPEFRALMQRTVRCAKALAAALADRGFGILTGGTDCHLLVADVRPFGTDAAALADRLGTAGISVNTKRLPGAADVTGLRIGTTVAAQRGMDETDMQSAAEAFLLCAQGKTGGAAFIVRQLCGSHPLPADAE